MNPLEVLTKALPMSKTEDDLINRAAQLAPPPAEGLRSPAPPLAQGGVAKFKPGKLRGKSNALVGDKPAAMIPPMTAGESRTNPRRGEILMGSAK